jgi:hypothetical protein
MLISSLAVTTPRALRPYFSGTLRFGSRGGRPALRCRVRRSGTHRSGARRRESTFTQDWQEAQQLLRERLQARDSNVLDVVRKGEKLSLEQWADFFLENYSKPPVRAEKTLGFDFLYEQKFAEVREVFASWESRNPEDPFGEVAVAASYLFEELYLQGVLTSDFFLNEKKFLHGIDGRPDPERMGHFREALARAR